MYQIISSMGWRLTSYGAFLRDTYKVLVPLSLDHSKISSSSFILKMEVCFHFEAYFFEKLIIYVYILCFHCFLFPIDFIFRTVLGSLKNGVDGMEVSRIPSTPTNAYLPSFSMSLSRMLHLSRLTSLH